MLMSLSALGRAVVSLDPAYIGYTISVVIDKRQTVVVIPKDLVGRGEFDVGLVVGSTNICTFAGQNLIGKFDEEGFLGLPVKKIDNDVWVVLGSTPIRPDLWVNQD